MILNLDTTKVYYFNNIFLFIYFMIIINISYVMFIINKYKGIPKVILKGNVIAKAIGI